MVDESQQLSPQQENPPPPQPSVSIPPQPQNLNKNVLIIAGAIAGIVCLCMLVCVTVFGTSLFKINQEKAPIESVLDSYMRHMVNQDVESAYALFSPRAQRQIPISDVEEMLAGNNYALFEGYQSLSVMNINISAAVNTNPNLPQGSVATVNGTIMYENEIQGSFNGVLERVNGKWMIDGFHITVPPSKIK